LLARAVHYRAIRKGSLSKNDKVNTLPTKPMKPNDWVGNEIQKRRFPMANSINGGLRASFLTYPRPFPAIVVGGLIVGVLDLAYAIAVYSPRKPIVIPQVIASGILGGKSFAGGTATVAMGVLLHFVIAPGAATVCYLASRKLTFMVSRAVICGLIYGALVYLFMHIVVLPLSAAPIAPQHFVYQAFEFVEQCFCVGLPIALSVRHHSR
jgi:hypothetical protein